MLRILVTESKFTLGVVLHSTHFRFKEFEQIMTNDMFQVELTEEELQQVTGGVDPTYFGGGSSAATYGLGALTSTSAVGGLYTGPNSFGNNVSSGYTQQPNTGFPSTFANQVYGPGYTTFPGLTWLQ
jgi:lactobin A/cerein 7B family class IIb bacteriocin